MRKCTILIFSCFITIGILTSCGSKSKKDNIEEEKIAKTEVKKDLPTKKYVQLAETMNASMPKVWPGGVRMDKAEAVSAKEYKFYFTFTKDPVISAEEFIRSSKPALAIGLKESNEEDTKMFRKDKMTVVFSYYKMDGSLFAEVVVSPNEYAE